MSAVAALGLAPLALAADAPADPIATHSINADVNDPGIDTTRGQNLVWTPNPERRVDKLLVFLGLGALNNRPTEFEWFGSEGGNLGYHTIVLAWKNEAPVAFPPPAGCGSGVSASTAPVNCAIDARTEILTGGPPDSPILDVNPANSIYNRLNKVLAHLSTAPEFSDEGWSHFVDADGQPKWSEIVIAGASLGAGQAVLIAEQHPMHRVALFTGWTDAQHGWVKRVATPADRYRSLIHINENFYVRTCEAYRELGLTQSCPLPDPALLLIDNREPPFGSRQLVFNLAPAANQPPVGDANHASTVRDGYTAKEDDLVTPSRKLVNGWRSTLGDSDADTWLDDIDNCTLNPNDQTDTDHDSIGDACDPTPLGTAPAIVVPAPFPVDATGPSGVIVTYAATATDDLDENPIVSCTPPSGTLFAIGDTLVECGSTDSLGNTSSASFVVTVRGAKEQLANLTANVVNASGLAAPAKAQLIASLQSLMAGFDPNKPLHRAAACLSLRVFTTLVRFVATPAQTTAWTTDANRIRAVLAC